MPERPGFTAAERGLPSSAAGRAGGLPPAGRAGSAKPRQGRTDAGLAIRRLTAAGQTVATAESITGGLIAGRLTAVAGASAVVRGGLVVYAADLKTRLAGVPAALIVRAGVVSEAVAAALADGAREACRADWGIGVTGVAGPGPSDGVPAGTVWLAVAGPDGPWTERLSLPGSRAAVRAAVVARAVAALLAALERHDRQSADAAAGA
ncbi:MAG: CinA family protein [Propionibacteriaceae bacterium]|jgi:nicotinamide-nucleotide amidase|nr:CinA family protein [Propionibacteriaceae bacterium]